MVSDRVGSADGGTPSDQLGGGGSIPTPALRRSEWRVHPISRITAQEFVRRHHYAGGGSSFATYVHGLFRGGDFMDADCQGIAWWIPPTIKAARATYPENPHGVLALTRLAVLPGVPKNAASFLLSRSRRQIDRERWPCLVTYADMGRGHTGAIYRADNWRYVGMIPSNITYRLKGRMVSIRNGASGNPRRSELLAAGATAEHSPGKHKFIHVEAA